MENLKELLKKKNLSLTAVRIALLEALFQNPHADATLLFNTVQKKITTATIQSIYKNLNVLVQEGIVREIKPKGQVSLYETRIGDNHHHIVCKHCKKVQDTDCHAAAPCLAPTHNYGFSIVEAEVIFWGICPDCQKAH